MPALAPGRQWRGDLFLAADALPSWVEETTVTNIVAIFSEMLADFRRGINCSAGRRPASVGL